MTVTWRHFFYAQLLESSQWEPMPVKCCGSEIHTHNKSLEGKKRNKIKEKMSFYATWLWAHSHAPKGPKYDMDAYMATLFGGELGTWVESWVEQRPWPNFQYKSREYLYINNKDLTLMIVNHFLMLSKGSKLGTLPPCWALLTRVGLGTPY